MTASLSIDRVIELISATNTNTTGTIYALPAKTNTVTCQLSSTTSPSAITVSINGGLTVNELELIDSTTITTGVVRTVNTNAAFIQAVISGIGAGGSGISEFAEANDL